MYKKALHSFFLKVHPDFFSHNKIAQDTNEKSIAQLNELLGWAKDFKAGNNRPPPSNSLSFTFYMDPTQEKEQGININNINNNNNININNNNKEIDGNKPLIKRQTVLSPTVATTAVSLSSRFELPTTFIPTQVNIGVAERAINKFLRELLRKSNCIDHLLESTSVAEDVENERMEVKPLRRKLNDIIRRKPARKSKTLLDEASESLAEQWRITPTPTIHELISSDQILFSRDLSPVQSASALDNIKYFLPEMMYEKWMAMPIIIADTFSVGEVTGTITIPWDFTIESFLAFLEFNSKEITECQQGAERFAEKIESLISKICKDLDLDDIIISCHHREAVAVLELLKVQIPILRYNNITGVSFEIGGVFGTRDNGVIIIDKNANPDTMRKAVKALKPRMTMQQELYKLSKQMLESITWHVDQIKMNIEPKGIDIFGNNNTYAERLKWSKELFSISPQLAQWDWSDFIFILGPLDIDWNRKIIILPYNVDGDSFVRYVEDIHKVAKEIRRDKIIKDTSMERRVEDTLQKSNNGSVNLFSRAAAVGNFGSNLESSLHRDELIITQQDITQQEKKEEERLRKERKKKEEEQKKKRALLIKANPYLEEYMCSNPDGNDSFTVERPLHHDNNNNINKDDEGLAASDNLQWEGFYRNPYSEMLPQRDIDDISATYLGTNRKYREEAVKKLLQELNDKLGVGKKKYNNSDSGFKLGDVTGLNDPEVFPKGFPVIAKGTYNGDREFDTRPF